MKPLLAAAAVALTLASGAFAQPTDAERREAARRAISEMTPEQKAAARAKAKAKWDAMTPEEQAAAKKRFAEKHPAAASAARR